MLRGYVNCCSSASAFRRSDAAVRQTPVTFTRNNDGDVAYVHNGITSGTPLVFLHGFSDMAECWLALMRRLDLELPMYALDAPAHGHTIVRSDEEYTNQIARRAVAFVRQLSEPAVLIGHSMGALQAMYMAGDAPELVRAIVLEDPPLAQDLSEWSDPATIAQLDGWIRKLQRQPRAESIAKAREVHPHWEDGEFEPWIDAKLAVDMSFVGDFAIHREPMETTLARINCPVLLLTGDPGPAIVTPETVKWAQTLCPTLQTQNFPGASHDIRRDAPDDVAAAIIGFLQDLAIAP